MIYLLHKHVENKKTCLCSFWLLEHMVFCLNIEADYPPWSPPSLLRVEIQDAAGSLLEDIDKHLFD